MRIFRCKRCGNIVQADFDYAEKDTEDRCPDPKAPRGYWYCTYEELVPKKPSPREVIKLTTIGDYKDGGSEDFIGSDGKRYWRCKMLGLPSKEGKIFHGSRVDKNKFTLAKGEFVVLGTAAEQYKRKTRPVNIIKQ